MQEPKGILLWIVLGQTKNLRGLRDIWRKREGEDARRQHQQGEMLLRHKLPCVTTNLFLGKLQKGPNPACERKKLYG